jgi:hypothetical protein
MRKGISFYLLSIMGSALVFVVGIGIYHFWGKDFNFSVLKELEIFNMDVSSELGGKKVIFHNNANEMNLDLNQEILERDYDGVIDIIGNYNQVINIGNQELDRYTNKFTRTDNGQTIAGFNFEIKDNLIEINIYVSQEREEQNFLGELAQQYSMAMLVLEEYFRPGGKITLEKKAELVQKAYEVWQRQNSNQEKLIDEV